MRLQLGDVEAALADDFFRRGLVYFDGVWAQATEDAQRQLLRVMAQEARPWTLADLVEATGQPPGTLAIDLRWAERHDISQKTVRDNAPPTWRFYVPLMRRWLLQK